MAVVILRIGYEAGGKKYNMHRKQHGPLRLLIDRFRLKSAIAQIIQTNRPTLAVVLRVNLHIQTAGCSLQVAAAAAAVVVTVVVVVVVVSARFINKLSSQMLSIILPNNKKTLKACISSIITIIIINIVYVLGESHLLGWETVALLASGG